MSATQPLRLELSPSPAFAAAIVGVHLAAAACVALVMPGVTGAALGALLAALGAASAWHHALHRSARSQRAIEILAAGEARVVFANSELAPVRPVGGMGVTRYWVALRAGSAGRRSMLVTGDMVESGKFRLLRLWARWGRLPDVAPRQLRD